MKRMMTALMVSLLASTSVLPQAAIAAPDRGERREEARDRKADRQEARKERRGDRKEAKQERRQDRAEVKQQRREIRAERPKAAQPRVRQAQQRVQLRQDRREDRRDRRVERRDDRQDRRVEQRIILRNQAARVDRERRQRVVRAQRHESRPAFRRPGEGRAFRDRDRNRRWYDSSHYRKTYHSARRYRAPAYRFPSGFYVRSWSFGDRLPVSWYSRSYYLDWWQYGLPRPPIGTEWVRMHDDAVLVDVWTGQVLAVYYDLFW